MGKKRAYDIPFVGLKLGKHEFTYKLGVDAFDSSSMPEVDEITADVTVTVDKHQSFLLLKFDVAGNGSAVCDRCGNDVAVNLWDEHNVVVKLVENPQEMNETETDPDVYYISRTDSIINVEDWLKEFVLLSIPTQKVCGVNEAGASLCNPQVIEQLENLKKTAETERIKSLWKGLDNIKQLDH